MAPPLNTERDAEICRRYIEGSTLEEIRLAFHISKERVRQILRGNGVYKIDRLHKKSERPNYLGITIGENDKEALKAEAKKRGVSMSSLSATMIREKLKAG